MPIQTDKAKQPLTKVLLNLNTVQLKDYNLDLDLIALMLNDKGLVNSQVDVCFFNKVNPYLNDTVRLEKDNRDGYGNETIKVDLANLPEYVSRIKVLAQVYTKDYPDDHFGLAESVVFNLIENETEEQNLIYDLNIDEEAFGLTTAFLVDIVKNESGEWYLEELLNEGDRYSSSLSLDTIFKRYGIVTKQPKGSGNESKELNRPLCY